MSNKKKGRRKKEHQLHYRLILSILFITKGERLYKNKIFDMIKKRAKSNDGTGLTFKQNTTNSIDELIKMRLIEEEEAENNKRILTLTAMGDAVADLIVRSAIYRRSYSRFIKSIEQKVFWIKDPLLLFLFETDQESEIMKNDEFASYKRVSQHKLKEIGWKEQEMDKFNEYRSNLIEYKNIFDRNYISMVLTIYSIISKNYAISNDSNIFKIIKNMILEMVEEKIDLMFNFENEIQGYNLINIDHKVDKKYLRPERTTNIIKFFNEINKIEKNYPIPDLLKKEMTEMNYAYLKMLQNYDPGLTIKFEGEKNLWTSDLVLSTILE